jgi:magnesium transporter
MGSLSWILPSLPRDLSQQVQRVYRGDKMMAHDRTAGDASAPLAPAMFQEVWLTLTPQERLERFHRLNWADAETFFLSLSAHDQAEVVRGLSLTEQRLWMRLLALDDAADVIQEAPPENRDGLLALLVEPIRREVMGLLAYDEEEAGGLMNPRFAHVRPEMRSREALATLRQQAKKQLDMPYYIYVLDREQRLLGVVSFRELFMAPAESRVRDMGIRLTRDSWNTTTAIQRARNARF